MQGDESGVSKVSVDCLPWVQKDEGLTVTLESAVELGVPRSTLVNLILEEHAESATCRNMFFAWLLMFAYACSAIIHQSAADFAAVKLGFEAAVPEMANFGFTEPWMGFKNVDDVNSHADFWSWLHHGFVPLVFDFEANWAGSSSNVSVANNNASTEHLASDSRYASSDVGSNTCHAGFMPITTKEMCAVATAADIVGLDNSSIRRYDGEIASTNLPGGCVLAPNGTVRFNSAAGNGMSDSKTICQRQHAKSNGMFRNYNRIIGGIRLRQQISGVEDERLHETGLSCRGHSPWPDDISSCLGGTGYELPPENYELFPLEHPRRERWLWVHAGLDEVRRQVFEMELENWLDKRTMLIEISLPQYNAEYGLYSMARTSFFFSRGGHIWKDLSLRSASANTYPYISYIVVDSLFLFCIFCLILSAAEFVRASFCKDGCSGVFSAFCDVWHLADLFSVCFSVVLVVLLTMTLQKERVLNREVAILPELIAKGVLPGSPSWKAQAEAAVEALAQDVRFSDIFRLVMSAYPFVVITRLFKAFANHKRFAIVTRTLYVASGDLLHFLIVFVPVLLSFGNSGLVLMGKDSDAFTTLPRSIMQTLRSLIGDLPWDTMKVVGRVQAASWNFFFQLVVAVTLFNILIALVMDAYSKVCTASKPSDTIKPKTVKQELMQLVRRGLQKDKHAIRVSNVVEGLVKENTVIQKTAGLSKRSTKPDHADSNWVEVRNTQSGTVNWAWYTNLYDARSADENASSENTSIFRSFQADDAGGAIVVHDGLDSHVVIRPGDSAEIAIRLDKDGMIHWYTDDSKKNRSDFDLLNSVRMVEASVPDDLITPSQLKAANESMNLSEARKLIRRALEVHIEKLSGSYTLEHFRTAVSHLDDRTTKLLFASLGTGKGNMSPAQDIFMKPELLSIRSAVYSAWLELEDAPPLERDNGRCTLGHLFESADEGGCVLSETRKYSSKQAFVQSGTMTVEDIQVGQQIEVLHSQRLVVFNCHIAGLAPQNADLQRRAAGMTGRVLTRDIQDKTAFVRIKGLGELWLAVSVLRPSRDPAIARKQPRRRTVILDGSRRDPKCSDGELSIKTGLEERVGDLELRLDKVQNLVNDAIVTAEEIRRDIAREAEVKAKSDQESAALARRRFELLRDGRAVRRTARAAWEVASGVAESRTDYLDTVHRLAEENAVLWEKVAGERLRLDVHAKNTKTSRQEATYHLNLRDEMQLEIQTTRNQRQALEQANRSDFAWLIGRADDLWRAMQHGGGRESRRAGALHRLRDNLLEIRRSLDGSRIASDNR
eukprot:TRINITY_DN24107_c0_g2_i1.p1 TRINITY_DN24107_c0_g2~~TRINITY_DN24107_c0_g2_i1.p1  ORF type:complete len:1288 (+),score=173.95 TRINITY_DN24107_c0_g2_i1:236-4099(+)